MKGGQPRGSASRPTVAALHRQAAEVLAQVAVPGLPGEGVDRWAAASLVVRAATAVLPAVVPILAVEALLGQAVHGEGPPVPHEGVAVLDRAPIEAVDPARPARTRLVGVRETPDVEPLSEAEVAGAVQATLALASEATERDVQVGAGQMSLRQGAAADVLVCSVVTSVSAEAAACFPTRRRATDGGVAGG